MTFVAIGTLRVKTILPRLSHHCAAIFLILVQSNIENSKGPHQTSRSALCVSSHICPLALCLLRVIC